MKSLTLFRHGKSGWDSPVARDFDRPINERGVAGSRLMGGHLRALGWQFDHVIASPAVRCTETLDAFWEGYGEILHPNWDRRVYLASAANLLDVLNEQSDDDRNILLCGHNPGLEDLILMLAQPGSSPDLHIVEQKFPTAAVARLALQVACWHDLDGGTAKLADLIRPRDLDPSLGPDMDD